MSANLSNFAVYVVDDNFFNGEWLKKSDPRMPTSVCFSRNFPAGPI